MNEIVEEALAVLAPLGDAFPPVEIALGNIKGLVADILSSPEFREMPYSGITPLAVEVIAAALPYRIEVDQEVGREEVERFLRDNEVHGMWYMFLPERRYRVSCETSACLFSLNFG